MLNLKDGTVLALSSTAPFYSAAVTAPFVVELVGSGAPLVYAFAVIPMVLVCAGMAANDARDPDKGTVYQWMRRISPRWGWFGGYSLAVTGIVATSGQAYVAVESFLPDVPALAKVAVGILLIVAAGSLSISSVKLTSWVQTLGIVLQALATAYLAAQLVASPWEFAPVTGTVLDWVHAVLLAVFAYWGFDSIFALTEESQEQVPKASSYLSLVLLIVLYGVYSGIISSTEVQEAAHHPLVVLAVGVAALMSLGSTVLPTARGISAMAERGDLPRVFTDNSAGIRISVVLASIWIAASFLNLGFFEDSVEALSVFVGIYFAISSYAAWRLETRGRTIHLVSTVLISLIAVLTAQQTFAVDYGSTSAFGVGGVGLIVVGLMVVGVLATVTRVDHDPVERTTLPRRTEETAVPGV